MAMQEAFFETPASHEATHYSNSEFENEWEIQGANYSNPEFENEWELPEVTNYSNPEFENEWEIQKANYSNLEFQNEWELPEVTNYSNPEFENEWEIQKANYSNPKFEDEGEYFFKKLGKTFKSVAKMAAPLAKKLAPIAAKTLVGMIPGVGAVAAPLAGKLTSALVKEGEMEAAQLEMEVFGTNEAEVANTGVAYEAALSEILAAQAAEATTEAEADVAMGATLPITITIMGGRRTLRSVTPILAQANSRLVKTFTKQGPAGRQLLRTIPAIQRRTVATLKAAARSGQPITGATAIRAMATSAHRVLNNPRTVQRTVQYNTMLRQRTAPPNPRRAAAATTRCPACASRLVGTR